MINPGNILIAKPFLQDGYFKRSVIYMCEHNAEGSLGFIINKPQGLLLKDVFPHLKHGNFPLFEGGPVSSNQLFYTHTLGKKLTDSLEVSKGVYWGGNFFELCYFIEHGKISTHQIRFYIGYSGWSKGQLEQEMDAESWVIGKNPRYEELIKVIPDEMWGFELMKINPGYRAFSDFAFDPSLN